ncbi:RbsD/FucU domain-containing protein, partial [Staphylococcus epidermidis]|uniref:RbsD/FucU domain-containing protein n=1 Tax=Staphylococcus epidermidis TaxID=1282 RepID=UPI0030BFC35A
NSTHLKVIKHLLEEHVEIEFIPHTEMKAYLSHSLNKGNIRTGEITPFSNIILESNVTF